MAITCIILLFYLLFCACVFCFDMCARIPSAMYAHACVLSSFNQSVCILFLHLISSNFSRTAQNCDGGYVLLLVNFLDFSHKAKPYGYRLTNKLQKLLLIYVDHENLMMCPSLQHDCLFIFNVIVRTVQKMAPRYSVRCFFWKLNWLFNTYG